MQLLTAATIGTPGDLGDGHLDRQRRSGADEHEQATTDLLPTLLELKTAVRHLSTDGHATGPLAALALVDRCSPARVSDLADVARLDPSVVSRQTKALRDSGLVEVEADPGDGRARRLRLSDEGRRTLAEGRAEMVRLVRERLAGWSVDELRTLTSGLRRLVADLGTPAGPDTSPPTPDTTPDTISRKNG